MLPPAAASPRSLSLCVLLLAALQLFVSPPVTNALLHEQVAFDADLAQRMSDRGVRILQATDAGELLPRVATTPDFFECRFCPWSERCWGLPA